jgi:hypothetical protein
MKYRKRKKEVMRKKIKRKKKRKINIMNSGKNSEKILNWVSLKIPLTG